MLDQQEVDRLDEIRSRERKTQDLMNKMADTVLKDLDRKRAEEEQKVQQYQQEKELRDRLDDDERLRRIKENQRDMRSYLDKQTDEKKGKTVVEKQESVKQAQIWKKELNMYSEEEKTIKQKVKDSNKEHAEFLKKQMVERKGDKKSTINREEYLLNKDILDKIDNKGHS